MNVILHYLDSLSTVTLLSYYRTRELFATWTHGVTCQWHYHGGMSKEYLTEVYEDFGYPAGVCQILHATEGASCKNSIFATICFSLIFCLIQGLDIIFMDVVAVVQYEPEMSRLHFNVAGGLCTPTIYSQ